MTWEEWPQALGRRAARAARQLRRKSEERSAVEEVAEEMANDMVSSPPEAAPKLVTKRSGQLLMKPIYIADWQIMIKNTFISVGSAGCRHRCSASAPGRLRFSSCAAAAVEASAPFSAPVAASERSPHAKALIRQEEAENMSPRPLGEASQIGEVGEPEAPLEPGGVVECGPSTGETATMPEPKVVTERAPLVSKSSRRKRRASRPPPTATAQVSTLVSPPAGSISPSALLAARAQATSAELGKACHVAVVSRRSAWPSRRRTSAAAPPAAVIEPSDSYAPFIAPSSEPTSVIGAGVGAFASSGSVDEFPNMFARGPLPLDYINQVSEVATQMASEVARQKSQMKQSKWWLPGGAPFG